MEYNWIHGKTTKFQKEVCLHRQNEKRPQNFYWHEARLRKSLKCKHGLFFFFLMDKEDDLEGRATEKNGIENHIQKTGPLSRSILCP